MMKGIFLFFVYAIIFLVANINAFDLNIKPEDNIYKLHTNMMIIVKKEKIKVFWQPLNPDDDPRPETFTLEILTNHTVDKATNRHICAGSYVIADNITDYYYKWKAIKLQKYDMYTFMVRANGYEKYGLSHRLYYAPSLYKFIKNKKGNSTFFIPYDDNKDMKAINLPENSPDNQQYPLSFNFGDDDDGIRATQRELGNTKFNAFVVSTVVSTTMLVSFIILAVYSYQKNTKTKGEGSFILFGKGKAATTCSFSEEFVEEYSDYKSDADSEVVRERLKRKGLEIERKKLMDSIKERSSDSSNNFTSASSNKYTSEVMTNSDFSFHGMEVLTFVPKNKENNTESGNSSDNNEQNKETKIEIDIVNIQQPIMSPVSSEGSNSDPNQSTTINVNP